MAKTLEGNITKYNIYKIFTKRVFLPLIAILLVDDGHLSLAQLGIIASVTALTQIILEVPTGYIADKWGHKKSIVFGSLLSAISVLPYIFYINFLGALIALVTFFVGYAFTSGALQALMHESLLALKREKEYTEIMGRAQSYGLLGNVVLVSLIPLTYSLNHKLPFILGFVCLLISYLVAVSFVQPIRSFENIEHNKKTKNEFIQVIRNSGFLKIISVFLLFGIVSAGFDQSGMYRELIFRSVKIPTSYFGFILAAGSLLAAGLGRCLNKLEKLTPAQFYLFDILYLCLACILVGLTENPLILIFAFILFPAYDRNRSIIFESRLFAEFPTLKNKATLISSLNFFPLLNDIWVPLLLIYCVGKQGMIIGYGYFGLSMLAISLLIYSLHIFSTSKLVKQTI